MADYISTLTGSQMDAALLDMAEHNSEAYAVGERNGIDVPPDDVTYHNNARYYAQQAQSIAPASVTEAVRWDIEQTALTDANKEMARENIDAGKNGAWTNPNLLDNPWFTVRQRGDGPFSGSNTEAFDRWRSTSNATLTGTTNGITVTTTVRTWGMQQRVAKGFFTVGKTYTISAMEQDGTITSATFTWAGSGISKYVTGANVGFEISTSNGSYDIIYFTTNYVGSVDLRAVKLELGTVSTLANDTTPEYGTELLKCQYRCVVYNLPKNFIFCRGVATSTTNIRAVIDLPTNFANSAFTITSTTNLSTTQGNTITAIAYSSTLPRNNKIVVDCTSTGLTSGNVYDVFTAQQTPQIIISADL